MKLLKRRKERNIDRIRKMDADELADVFNRITDYCPVANEGRVYCDKTDCKPCIVKWLNADAEVTK